MFGPVCHLEELVDHRDIPTLADSARCRRARTLSEHSLEGPVLVAHVEAQLLHDTQRGVPVEARERAAHRQVRELQCAQRAEVESLGADLRLGVGGVLIHGLLGPRHLLRGRLQAGAHRRLGLGARLLLGLALALLLLLGVLLLFFLLLLRSVRRLLRDVQARLVCEGVDGAVHLRPIKWEPVVQLAANDLHQLCTRGCVQALESQVVVGGNAGRIQSLPHGHQNLRSEVNLSLPLRKPVQNQHRHALLGKGHQPIVVVLDGAGVVPEPRERVAGVRRQAGVLSHRNDLLGEAALCPVQGHSLVADRVARPLDRRRELLAGQLRQEVARHREQHVGGQIDVLATALVVVQVLLTGHTQASHAQLLARQLAGHRHQPDGALHGCLDLNQDLLYVRGQVPEERMDEVSHGGRTTEDGDEQGAGALVRLELIAAHVDELLVVAVPPPVPLDEQPCRIFELLPDELQTPRAHLLQLVVQDELDVQLGLKALPVALDLDARQVHPSDQSPSQHAPRVRLDVGCLSAPLLLQLPPEGAPDHGLDLRGMA
mmetsp:Transcript_108523/g.346329  ORF Transcript_108523/g.346329 Transcript_108523/m.346329 type:complete len:543 (+) Transcript_108523:1265-2893(+)